MDPHSTTQPTEVRWTPEVIDRSTDDRQLVVLCRRDRGQEAYRRSQNVMEARFARFIVRDAIKHGSDNLPAVYLIEPADDAERARHGSRPITEEVKQRLRSARAAKRELRETFHVTLDGSDAEPAFGRATAADPASQHEGEAAMSKMSKAITEGIRKQKGTKKASSKAAKKKAAFKKKAMKKFDVEHPNQAPAVKAPKAEKKAPVRSKSRWYVLHPDGSTSGPIDGIIKAAKSVGHNSDYCRLVHPGHYTVTVAEKLYHIVTPEAAARDGVAITVAPDPVPALPTQAV